MEKIYVEIIKRIFPNLVVLLGEVVREELIKKGFEKKLVQELFSDPPIIPLIIAEELRRRGKHILKKVVEENKNESQPFFLNRLNEVLIQCNLPTIEELRAFFNYYSILRGGSEKTGSGEKRKVMGREARSTISSYYFMKVSEEDFVRVDEYIPRRREIKKREAEIKEESEEMQNFDIARGGDIIRGGITHLRYLILFSIAEKIENAKLCERWKKLWRDVDFKKFYRESQLFLSSYFILKEEVYRLIERVGESSLILDFGAGAYSPLVRALKTLKTSISIIALDVSREALEELKNNNRDMECIVAASPFLPFRSNVFDMCFAGDVFHNFYRVQKPIHLIKILSVLKPEGIFLMLEPAEKYEDCEEVKQYLESIGCNVKIKGMVVRWRNGKSTYRILVKVKKPYLSISEEKEKERLAIYYIKEGDILKAKELQKNLIELIEKIKREEEISVFSSPPFSPPSLKDKEEIFKKLCEAERKRISEEYSKILKNLSLILEECGIEGKLKEVALEFYQLILRKRTIKEEDCEEIKKKYGIANFSKLKKLIEEINRKVYTSGLPSIEIGVSYNLRDFKNVADRLGLSSFPLLFFEDRQGLIKDIKERVEKEFREMKEEYLRKIEEWKKRNTLQI